MGTFSSETSANRHNSSKFETLIALQNDTRWLLLQSCFFFFFFFFFFLISPWEAPPDHPTRRDTREILDLILFYSTSAPRRPPPPPRPHLTPIILMHKTLLFAGHLPMIIYDFGIRGFICSLCTELPLLSPFPPIFITSASDWIRLLLCKGKFPAFFFVFFFCCFLFCWKR